MDGCNNGWVRPNHFPWKSGPFAGVDDDDDADADDGNDEYWKSKINSYSVQSKPKKIYKVQPTLLYPTLISMVYVSQCYYKSHPFAAFRQLLAVEG